MDQKVSAIYKQTVHDLDGIYGEREAAVIADLIFADLLHISKIDRITNPNIALGLAQIRELQKAKIRLLNQEPIQHIIGKTHFYNREFKVNEHTLIPRPETEELVDLIKTENNEVGLKILDIGTGSGCIAISLALELKSAEVYAIDISNDALAIAEENAISNEIDIKKTRVNILEEDIPWQGFDIIVSNPPYIPLTEKNVMDKNVTDFEPDIALFVPDNDPLLFYRVIGGKALKSLKPTGKIYFEIHENYRYQVQDLLSSIGFKSCIVIKDMQGKERILKGMI